MIEISDCAVIGSGVWTGPQYHGSLLAYSPLHRKLSYHQFLCISANFEQLCDGVHKALVVEIAHLLNLTVMIPYPGIQLFHEALVGVGLVIIDRPARQTR